MSQPKQEVIPPVKPRRGAKMRSPRYYIAMMDAVFDQACRGLRSTADAQRLTDMLGKQLEAHLAAVQMEMHGVDGLIDIAPGPEEKFTPPAVRAHRQKRVVAKRGRDRHGAPIDEVTVSISSSGEDEDAETDAQIEALT